MIFSGYIIHVKAFINLAITIFIIFIVIYLSSLLTMLFYKKRDQWLKPFHVKGNEIISTSMFLGMIRNTIKIIKWVLILTIAYLSIPFILQELPTTHDYAVSLMTTINTNITKGLNSLLNFIPNLFFIAFVIFITTYIVKFLKFIFQKIENKEIIVDNFYPEWGNTTFQLLRFFICMFALVIIYPYLPGAGTKALEGISVFLGLMISIGSSSAIANIIAGVMISYMRAFQIGDYVKIGDAMGRIQEKGLIVTKIMTYKNEEITIPNTQILSSQVTNYSTQAENKSLILYTTITIGYDTPWPLVHKMMIEAAERSMYVSKDHKPFVLQTALNDYHISYQLNAFTEHEDRIPTAYSELHQNLQSVFSEYQVEIMSPGFTVLRNTPKDTTPSANELKTTIYQG